ncbi:MAG: DNA mismatch repair endonuclease MutL [Chloroflexi bacterium]|nr:DNA mismatch repair endonuclease MutL [Chloroflexota bacterium]
MPIKVLSPEVATKIAAGEVVERPASVIKELLENSLDAGATDITVEVRGGGIDYLRVADNGCGIPSGEVELAFQRYATSKLQTSSDLEAISTLGFRGEALPSIAAVSHISLLTHASSDETGTVIEMQSGRVLRLERQGAPPGTTVTVRHLFGDFPARRKFLRSIASETGRIHALATHYALAYPEIRLALVVDGITSFAHTGGSGDMREAMASVYDSEVAGAMLEIAPHGARTQDTGLAVWGIISPPSLTRANRSYIAFFVNRRWIQSRLLMYSLEQAYHGFLMERRYPLAAVNVSIAYEDVDVNVHPAKSEVRFRRENHVFSCLQEAVRRTLIGFSPVPSLPTSRSEEARLVPKGEARSFWFSQVAQGAQGSLPETLSHAPVPRETLPILRVLGQVQNTYIATEGPKGMYLIDQHAAHERVLFEKVREDIQKRPGSFQTLLEPVSVELKPHQEELVQSQRELMSRVGFEIEAFGPGTYLLRGIPNVINTANPKEAFLEVMDFLAEGGGFEEWKERFAYSIACHGAIKAGMTLSYLEMSELVRQLERSHQPHTCPHGRPTMIYLSSSHLEREFGRR